MREEFKRENNVMTSGNEESKTLHNNSVRNFILRIDSPEFTSKIFLGLIEKLENKFDRTEIQSTKQIIVTPNQEKSGLFESDHKEYKLVSSVYSSVLTLSEAHKAIHVQCHNYIDSTSYSDTIKLVIEQLPSLVVACSATRIGMRFINEFKSANKTQLGRIFNKRHKAVVKNMLQNNFCSRAVAIEEYNYDCMKSRVQYGVLNKFHPSVIVNFDASLDIDVYDDSKIDLEDWNEVIKKLNHKAYEIFQEAIDEKTLQGMK